MLLHTAHSKVSFIAETLPQPLFHSHQVSQINDSTCLHPRSLPLPHPLSQEPTLPVTGQMEFSPFLSFSRVFHKRKGSAWDPASVEGGHRVTNMSYTISLTHTLRKCNKIIYIYICVCVCVCVQSQPVYTQTHTPIHIYIYIYIYICSSLSTKETENQRERIEPERPRRKEQISQGLKIGKIFSK